MMCIKFGKARTSHFSLTNTIHLQTSIYLLNEDSFFLKPLKSTQVNPNSTRATLDLASRSTNIPSFLAHIRPYLLAYALLKWAMRTYSTQFRPKDFQEKSCPGREDEVLN